MGIAFFGSFCSSLIISISRKKCGVSFLKDTPHFLREIEMINEEQKLPKNAILVTMDVSALYTNIPQSEGVECVEEELNKRTNPKVPTGFLTRVLEFILKYNIFEFNQELYQQVIGTAMGTRPALPYANIFMANKIDDKIIEASSKMKDSEEDSIKLLKHFLDDIFMIYFGSTKRLHNLLKEINKIHPNIKSVRLQPKPSQVKPKTGCS